MSDKKFNFNLGNRSLTADESTAVEIAKERFRKSLTRHHDQSVAGRAVFEATATVTAAGTIVRPRGSDVGAGNEPAKARGTGVVSGNETAKPRGTDVVRKVPSSWTTNTVAPPNRKY